MSLNVLFVDDEPNVLSGLRRILRPLRSEWAAEFAEGGPQALAILEKAPYDVVVTDIRMPGMSGVQLLEEVRRRHPKAVRIILSGQCDEESSAKAACVAHQMLSKPCDAETLKSAVARACARRDLLSGDALVALVARRGSVPSPPALYAEVARELEGPEPCLDRVAELVARDPGMSAKILHLVNSSFFALRTPASSPKGAVTLLGLETVRTLVLTFGIFSRFEPVPGSPLSAEALWDHSRAAGELAGAIAEAEGADARVAAHAAVAGLLHDIGKLVLLDSLPEAYVETLSRAGSEDRPLWEVERETLGASHAEVGASLLGLWGVPEPVVDAVAWHHRPGECPAAAFGPVTAVHAADALLAGGGPGAAARLDEAYLARLGLADRKARWEQLRGPRTAAGGRS